MTLICGKIIYVWKSLKKICTFLTVVWKRISLKRYKKQQRKINKCNCIKLKILGNFPGSPLVKTLLPIQGVSPSQGTKIPHAIWHGQKIKNKKNSGTSLIVQWFGIHLSLQGTWVQSLVREDLKCPQNKKVCTTYWSPCALEPVLHKRSYCFEKPVHLN